MWNIFPQQFLFKIIFPQLHSILNPFSLFILIQDSRKIRFCKKNFLNIFFDIPSSYAKIWGGDFTFGIIPKVGEKQKAEKKKKEKEKK